MPGDATLLVLLLTATLAAFGGIYAWALPPVLVATLFLSWRSARLARTPDDTRYLDLATVGLVAAIAIQLVPLPAGLRAVISPHLADVTARLRPGAGLDAAALAPLSVDPSGTWHALGLVAATVMTYRAARNIFAVGGVRRVCRALTTVGVVFAGVAIVQRAVTPTLIYGVWRPLDAGAVPFGPVVNRNHFAGWLLMASAVTTGYLIARVSRRMDNGRGGPSLRSLKASVSESRVQWTGLASLVITVTVVAAQSRSAIVGLAVSFATLLQHVTRAWAFLVLGFGITIFMAVGPVDRIDETLTSRGVSRTTIWRDTLPMTKDFILTGTGAGSFAPAMLTYQRTHAYAEHLGQDYSFNHAHNHYLQLVTEGGVLLTLPFVAVLVAFVRVARRRWREDSGELRAVRLGAIAGLAGIAVQSVWEVPLTMPAAALLGATLAALATYKRSATSSGAQRTHADVSAGA